MTQLPVANTSDVAEEGIKQSDARQDEDVVYSTIKQSNLHQGEDDRLQDLITDLRTTITQSNAHQVKKAFINDVHSTSLSSNLREPQNPTPEHNIIIFGESGSGKSSLVNMILGTEEVAVSNQATGCTFESQGYPLNIGGHPCKVWDTTGLNEGDCGTVSADGALRNLQDLVGNLRGEASLLVYCIRASRFRNIWKFNYDMFYQVIFGGRVPIVAVVTGLENEENMDDWWTANKDGLAGHGLVFSGHACVTASKGKFVQTEGVHMFEEEYEASTHKVLSLLKASLSDAPCRQLDMSDLIAGIPDRMEKYIEHYSMRTEAPRIAGERHRGGGIDMLKLLQDVVIDFWRVICAHR